MSPQLLPEAKACAERRARFLVQLSRSALPAGGCVLVPAGQASARNYPANTWPFRASSHFLHLVGRPIEGAYLLIGPELGAALYWASPGDDDELWHGPSPSVADWAQALGLPIHEPSELPAALRGRPLGLLAPPDALGAAAARRLIEALGGEDAAATLAAQEAIIEGRLVHDAWAQAQLREAAELTVRAHHAAMRQTAPDLAVPAVAAAFAQVFAAEGRQNAYLPIVTTHGEILHEKAPRGVCRAGELLLADVGGESSLGYAADLTRTWPVTGRFSATQQAIYEVVLAAQQAAIAALRPGQRYRDIHNLAAHTITQGLLDLGIFHGSLEDLLEARASALFFPHGVGHLIGLDVHDMEDLGDRAGYAPGRVRGEAFDLRHLRLDRDLREGMAVTIEPGFYQVPALLGERSPVAALRRHVVWSRLADFEDVRGIRIEDDVLIGAAGPLVLTEGAARSVADVERVMRS